jgi:hypothetical protein
MGNKIVVTLTALLCSSAAFAADISNADLASAIQSMNTAQAKAYQSMIASREKIHGCRMSATYATDAQKNTIPTTLDFGKAVEATLKTIEYGKYAKYFDAGFNTSGSLPAQEAADILHAFANTSRSTYTKTVVTTALNSKCSKPNEQWAEEKGLPLPAQFTRALADGIRKGGIFSYSLQSEWAINKQNMPKTDFEKSSVKSIEQKQTVYGLETLGGKEYFSAAYPDLAVNDKCSGCHNEHPDSPRKDFKVGDVMGEMIIRIPLK